jgi:hypothetical protein
MSSAIIVIQSDLSSVIFRNCTLRTTSFCLGYVNNVTYNRLPLNLSDLLSRALPVLNSYQLSGLESLDQDLKLFSLKAIKSLLIVGIISTVILIIVL